MAELDQHGSELRAGRDPSRTKTSRLVWTEGKHKPCNICNGKHGEGKHLWRDCPDKQSNTNYSNRKGKPDAASKGAAKLLSPALTPLIPARSARTRRTRVIFI